MITPLVLHKCGADISDRWDNPEGYQCWAAKDRTPVHQPRPGPRVYTPPVERPPRALYAAGGGVIRLCQSRLMTGPSGDFPLRGPVSHQRPE